MKNPGLNLKVSFSLTVPQNADIQFLINNPIHLCPESFGISGLPYNHKTQTNPVSVITETPALIWILLI